MYLSRDDYHSHTQEDPVVLARYDFRLDLIGEMNGKIGSIRHSGFYWYDLGYNLP